MSNLRTSRTWHSRSSAPADFTELIGAETRWSPSLCSRIRSRAGKREGVYHLP